MEVNPQIFILLITILLGVFLVALFRSQKNPMETNFKLCARVEEVDGDMKVTLLDRLPAYIFSGTFYNHLLYRTQLPMATAYINLLVFDRKLAIPIMFIFGNIKLFGNIRDEDGHTVIIVKNEELKKKLKKRMEKKNVFVVTIDVTELDVTTDSVYSAIVDRQKFYTLHAETMGVITDTLHIESGA